MVFISGSSLSFADSEFLQRAGAPDTAVLNDQTFLYVPSITNDSLSVYTVSAGGILSLVNTINDTGATTLDGARSVVTFEVDGNPFLAVIGVVDDGLTIYALTDSAPHLTFVDRAVDSDNIGYELDSPNALTVVTVDGGTFLYVGSALDRGVSVFQVASDGSLSNVQNVADTADLEISGAIVSDSFVLSGQTFLPVAGLYDTGATVFAVDDTTGLLTESATFELEPGFFPSEISSYTPFASDTTYLFLPGLSGDSVKVLAYSGGSEVTEVASIRSPTRLEDVSSSQVYTLGDKVFVAFGSYAFAGIEVFEFDLDYLTLSPVQSLTQVNASTLSRVYFGDAFDVDGVTYAGVIASTANFVGLYEIGGGDDVLTGTQDNDTLFGGGGDDIFYGLAGNDVLHGELGDDVIYAGSGDDTVFVSLGNDQLFGGAGDDTLDVDNLSVTDTGVTIDMFNERVVLPDGTIQFATNFERLTGTSQDDTLIGNEKNNTLSGVAGDDTLRGREGDDVMLGGAGQDTLIAGDGDDIVQGGDGNDLLNGGNDDDVLFGDAGDDMQFGAYGDDDIRGGTGNDLLRGNQGNDDLRGDADDDDLRGGDGDDALFGGNGNDFLSGDGDDDSLFGGVGSDIMVGGMGADRFVFAQIAAGGGGFNAVRDFTDGQDLIDVTQFAFADVSDVLSLAVQRAWGVRIDLEAGNNIALEHVTLSDLGASDFIL